MNMIATVLFLSLLFGIMAVGLIISKKALRRGCSVDPDDCACQKEGKDPSQCDK